MSVISKDLARQIATKLTEKSRIAKDELHKEYRQLVTDLYKEQVPDDVSKCFKNNPDWFYTQSSIRLDGHGFDWEYVATMGGNVIANGGSNAFLKLTSKTADKITNSKRKWEKAKDSYELLKDETVQALLALKTFANIRKELPEASPMLPPPMSNALVCNFDSLKKKLNKQPEILKPV